MTPERRRPRVAVSSCLRGEAVRYDGTHRRADAILADLAPRFELVSVCPELELGMGVPREPIQLCERPGGRVLLLGRESGRDHTGAMRAFAERRVDALVAEGVAGYVLKRASPSCGLRAVKTVELDGSIVPKGRGLFAAALVARLPDLPVADEDDLATAEARARFADAVEAYDSRLRRRNDPP